MLMLTSAVPTGLFYLLPHMAGFTYYSTPENEWWTLAVPLLPNGLVIKDPAVTKGFFEGIGAGEGVPYGAWLGPLCVWGVLLGLFHFTMISLMVILRKRWIEEERLLFPLAQLPLAMVEDQGGKPWLMRNRVFWVGFSVAALWGLTGILSQLVSFIPAINLSFSVSFYRNSISVPFSTQPMILGLGYLVSMDILGSIVVFALLSYFHIYLIMLSGSAILGSSPYVPYAHWTHLHQEVLGSLFVLVGVGIYEARYHLSDVFRKAIGSAPHVDDSDEMLSYRTAVIGSIAGVAFICWWLQMTGVSWWVVPIFVAIMLVTFLGLTRILAETGVVMNTPLSPMQVMLNTAGTETLGGPTVSGFFLAQTWAFPTGSWIMASTSTALKLTHRKGVRGRPLFYACFLALGVASAAGAVALLYYAYTLGAYGFANSWHVIKALNFHLQYYGGAIKEPAAGQPIRILWSGVGAVAMAILIIARKAFFWWPIHPIGYPIGTISPGWWFSVFMAWLIKRNILKYGGPSLYGRSLPFFLGLILGDVVMRSTGLMITLFTGQT